MSDWAIYAMRANDGCRLPVCITASLGKDHPPQIVTDIYGPPSKWHPKILSCTSLTSGDLTKFNSVELADQYIMAVAHDLLDGVTLHIAPVDEVAEMWVVNMLLKEL